jgi:hypothetical protein
VACCAAGRYARSFTAFRSMSETAGRQSWCRRKGRGTVIRKLSSGGYRLYSRKRNPRTGRRRNLGTFKTREAAEQHERAVQFFKHHG